MSEPRATSVVDHTHGPVDTITLDADARHRRRMKMVSDGGISFLLDLPKATLLRDRSGLVLEDGRVIEVRALPEPLYAVYGRDARHLTALAWQIGNRHIAAQINDDHLLIRRDRVIAEMVEGLGGEVRPVEAVFDPQSGAYDEKHEHHHA